MVYGRILYNNIKEYTPKWYPTIPYSQTVKPTFGIFWYLFSGKKPQVVSVFNSNPNVKNAWRIFGRIFQQNSFMWQIFIFGMSVLMYYTIYTPFLTMYQANNSHRTYQAAIAKEKAHKKKLKEQEGAS
jgi:hypothetical protein